MTFKFSFKFLKILNHHATFKQKYAQSIFLFTKHLPFVNVSYSKEIMKRTRLTNIFLKNKTDYNKRECSQQHNNCVPFVKKAKSNIKVILINEKKLQKATFGRPLFLSDKIV